jgi:LacI family transcriptional regulator
MARIPRVALLVETSRGYGRALLRGIVRYARLHGPWGFYVTPGDFAQELPPMRDWGGTGIIARIETPEVARAILEAKLPTIALDLTEEQLEPGHPLARLSEVASDSCGAARLAAEHLLDRGFRQFAFVGIAGRVWSDRRQASFVERISEAGIVPRVYAPPRRSADQGWDREQPRLGRWLAALPTPCGVMACNDDRGRQVLEACRAQGLRIPEDLAVVGVDNDELLCELADPPLSSVALNAEAGGYRAAGLLEQLMRGRVRRPQRLVVEPLHVVARRSTAIDAQEDPEVAAAIHFLHDHACGPIGVGDIVRHLAISRRALEIRFRRSLGRSLHDEIRRVRLDRACRLLVESELPIPRVAASSGFRDASYLARVFQKELGTSPARYRRQMRTPDDQPGG